MLAFSGTQLLAMQHRLAGTATICLQQNVGSIALCFVVSLISYMTGKSRLVIPFEAAAFSRYTHILHESVTFAMLMLPECYYSLLLADSVKTNVHFMLLSYTFQTGQMANP